MLDVGSGCGVLTAAMALMAGPQGRAVGVDIKPVAVSMAITNVKHLQLTNHRCANGHSIVLKTPVHHAPP